MTTREQEERERNQEAFQLTPGQMDFVVRCMSEWINLSGNCPTDADVVHSTNRRQSGLRTPTTNSVKGNRYK